MNDGEFERFEEEFQKAFEVSDFEDEKESDLESHPLGIVKSMCENRRIGNMILKHSCGILNPKWIQRILEALKQLISSSETLLKPKIEKIEWDTMKRECQVIFTSTLYVSS